MVQSEAVAQRPNATDVLCSLCRLCNDYDWGIVVLGRDLLMLEANRSGENDWMAHMLALLPMLQEGRNFTTPPMLLEHQNGWQPTRRWVIWDAAKFSYGPWLLIVRESFGNPWVIRVVDRLAAKIHLPVQAWLYTTTRDLLESARLHVSLDEELFKR